MKTSIIALALVSAGLFGACRQDMHDQPRYKAYGQSAFFADGRNMRPLVPGTVAQGHLMEDDHFYRGKVDGKLAETFPMEVTAEILARGKERYQIYCQPCHSPVGDGNGMIVQRGMKRPPSYHIERLQKSAPGYFFDVITNGFGVMYDYSDRILPEDRWAIVAYVRVLQQSQATNVSELTPEERAKLDAIPTSTTNGPSSSTGQ
jgi:mono/diheme cytochrome c family protein